MIGLLILSLLMFSACTGSHHAVTHTPATAELFGKTDKAQ